jgi:antirestriction protein ArdC
MTDERVRRITEEALDRLAAALDAGHSEPLRDYLAAQARFHRYSWNNVLLIHAQRPTATRVAGYHTWSELGRAVRKGEKGIMIYAPIRAKEPESRPAAPAETARDASRLTGFRAAYVFDVEQTHGRPLPSFAQTTGDPKHYTEKLKALVAKRGIVLDYDRTIAPAHGLSTGGRIQLFPGLTSAEEFSVLSHELAHEMLHHRQDGQRAPIPVRETQAEAVSFVVCRAVGLETHSAAADYIALYNGNRQTLADSLAAIHDAATRILDDLIPEARRPLSMSDERAPDAAPADRSNESETAPGPEPHTPSEPGPNPSDSMSWGR